MTKSRYFPTRRSKAALALGMVLGVIAGVLADSYGAGEWGKALAATAGLMLGTLLDRETFYGVEPKAKRRSKPQ